MPTLALTDPVNGTTADASVIAANNAAIKTIVNGTLDLTNFASGYSEYVYAAVTASVSVTNTTESASTTIIAASNTSFAAVPVMVSFFAPKVKLPTGTAGDNMTISLFEGSTQLAELAYLQTPAVTSADYVSVHGMYRFTPTAATHTYSVKAFVNVTTGTPAIVGGPGGTGALAPMFLRIVKA